MPRRKYNTIPFGYVHNPGETYLTAIPSQLDAIRKAKDYVDTGTMSIRTAAEWLEFETGRKLSHVGLGKRFKQLEEEAPLHE